MGPAAPIMGAQCDRYRSTSPHRPARLAAGPRNCIGNHFAMLEDVIALASILRAVRVRTDTTAVRLGAGITLRPAQPVPARLTEIA